MNILLVDDRPPNLLALEAVLEPLGQNLLRAGSGEEALAQLLRNDVALILLDVQMPGLDGFQTARLIRDRARTRLVPIIFLTAVNHAPEHSLRGYEVGAVDYITKPYDPYVLRAKVEIFLELHAKTRTIAAQAEELRRNLDERSRAQRTLADRTSELERSNAELEGFVQVASHDLQQPLTSMRGLLILLRERIDAERDPESRVLLDRCIGSADRMTTMIRDLMRYARDSSTVELRDRVDLPEVLRAATENLRSEIVSSGARIESDELPSVRGDPGQLVQLLQNLVGNAIKFRRDAAPVVRVRHRVEGDEVTLSVEDDGIGIEPGHEGRIFTLFHRLHPLDRYPGTGIGLAVCKKIVEQHGGRIWAERLPERGAAFRFTLPLGAPEAG